MRIRSSFCFLVSLVLLMSSCEKYFGDKTSLDFIDIPNFEAREVAYVPIQPVLKSFVKPVDITIGFDELIYVVDEFTEEVISMDEAGNIIGRMEIPGATAVVQDRRFDLLVIGTKDTVVNSGGIDTTLSFTAIYRIRMLGANGYGLNNGQIINEIVHPFYFKSSYSGSDRQVRFNRIAILADNGNPDRNNQYYVSRSGSSNNGLNPDDAILWFNNTDELVSGISVNTSSGLFNDYFESPFGLVGMAQPPQFTANNGGDFIYTSLDESNAIKIQYIEFLESDVGAEFRARILATGDTSKADGFINSPNRFKQPKDITVAGDASSYIFIVDAETDSLYQFTLSGYEGVQPPAASGLSKFQKASFGGTGDGLTQFRNPTAVAYYNKVLYVADAGNGRVLRFKLTLDFD